ncbi:hypothetical protein MSPP1_002059 [Malassezia sp. CBS 17886]|nr:hypothetical protein MSPP1_002059 [Malassezia sp. CBS 17886]
MSASTSTREVCAASARDVPGNARAIKSRLFAVLGDAAEEYWATLGALITASVDQREFQERIAACLPQEYVPLHNALVLSLLSASSARPAGGLDCGRADAQGVHASSSPIRMRHSALCDSDSDDEALCEPPVDGVTNQRAYKRLRHMYAGLPQKERLRLSQLPKNNNVSVHTSAAVWAGAGAELLEKKRKEDERRRAVEDKRRTREAKSAVGALSWRRHAVQAAAQTDSLRAQLSMAMQESFLRGVVAQQCVEAHELPDVHTLQDRMAFTAVEAGLVEGAHIQAAAVVLAALQDHLRNIISSALLRVRSCGRPHARAARDADAAGGADGGVDAAAAGGADGGGSMDAACDADAAGSADTAGGGASLDAPGRLTMPDMAALFALSPHVVVEPLGQGPQERLLAPDCGDDSWKPSSTDGLGVSWAREDEIARIARDCATTKLASTVTPSPPSLSADVGADAQAQAQYQLRQQQQQQRDAMRNQVLLDQLAPLRLLDRRTLAEALASGDERAATTGQPAPTTTPISAALAQHYQAGGNHRHLHSNPSHRHKDEFFDVVDPVALLGRLCE